MTIFSRSVGCALAFGRAEARRFIGRIHIRRFRLEFGGAGVDAFEHRTHAQFVAQRADFVLGHRTRHRARGLHRDARTVPHRRFHAGPHIERFDRQKRQALVRKAHRFQAAQRLGAVRQAVRLDLGFCRDDFREPLQKPRIKFGNRMDFGNAHALAQGLRRDQQPVGRRARSIRRIRSSFDAPLSAST